MLSFKTRTPTTNGRPFRVLISGGGVSGLIFAYHLLKPLDNMEPLPIEITIAEKATAYSRVGALITLDGQQTLDILNEMGLENELKTMEVPLEKELYYNHKGKIIRDFDANTIHKYKDNGKLFERSRLHEILYAHINHLIKDYRFKTIVQNIKQKEGKKSKSSMGIEVLLVDKNNSNSSGLMLQDDSDDEEESKNNNNDLQQRISVSSSSSGLFDTNLTVDTTHNNNNNGVTSSSPKVNRVLSSIINNSPPNTPPSNNNSSPNSSNNLNRRSLSVGSLNSLNDSSSNVSIENFDLVVAADGINSSTRKLVFGDDNLYRKYLNVGYMCFIVDLEDSETCQNSYKVRRELENGSTANLLLDKGRYLSVSRHNQTCYVTCIYSLNNTSSEEDNMTESGSSDDVMSTTSSSSSSEERKDKDLKKKSGSSIKKTMGYRSSKREIPADQRKMYLLERFGDVSFLFPNLIQLVKDPKSIYYDDLAQIHIDVWHKGRVALLGDSCQALTPLSGKGASMAIIGAYQLANDLKKELYDYAKQEGFDNIGNIPLKKMTVQQKVQNKAKNQGEDLNPCLENAFESYEKKMVSRVKEIQKKTIREGDLFLTDSPMKQFFRDSCMKLLPKKVLMKMSRKDSLSNSPKSPGV